MAGPRDAGGPLWHQNVVDHRQFRRRRDGERPTAPSPPARSPVRPPAAIPGQEFHQRRGDHRGDRQPVLGRIGPHPADQSLRQFHRESHCPVGDLDPAMARGVDVPAGLPHGHTEPAGEHLRRLRRSGPGRSEPHRGVDPRGVLAVADPTHTRHVINIQPDMSDVVGDALLRTRRLLQPPVTQCHLEGEVAHCVGGVISPLLANLLMHYALDAWMAREFPTIEFERYCDDVVVHCRTLAMAHRVREAIADRLAECGGLQLHPVKTRIVYCKDARRRGSAEHTSFTFLGYEFRVRQVRTKTGRYLFGFNPAISKDAGKRLRREIRSWRLHHRSGSTLEQLAAEVNPVTRGWINYYGAFRPSELQYTLNRINDFLMRWLLQKYKRFHGSQRRAWDALGKAALDRPTLFAHWRIVHP